MDYGARIKEARLKCGWTQEQLADASGTTQSTIERIESGRAQRSRFLPEILAALGLTTNVAGSGGATIPMQAGTGAATVRLPAAFTNESPDLPVYAAVEGGAGEMVVSTDAIEWVPRPWFLRHVRDGYAVLVTGESMLPAFEPGDMALVNPKLPPMRGKDAIFVQRKGGDFVATIKRLVKITPEAWVVRQFNPPEGREPEFELPRSEWPEAFRVVGKYYG